MTFLTSRWPGLAAWLCTVLIAASATPFRSLQARGPLLIAIHAADLVAVLALLCLCLAIGETILRRTGFAFEDSLQRSVFGLAIGMGALAVELLVAGGALGLNRWVVALVLLANAIYAARDLTTMAGRLARAWQRPREIISLVSVPAIVALSVVAAVLLIQALAPPTRSVSSRLISSRIAAACSNCSRSTARCNSSCRRCNWRDR